MPKALHWKEYVQKNKLNQYYQSKTIYSLTMYFALKLTVNPTHSTLQFLRPYYKKYVQVNNALVKANPHKYEIMEMV